MNTVVHNALTWVLDGGGDGRTYAIEGPEGSGKSTSAILSAERQAPRRLGSAENAKFDAIVWIECSSKSPSNVALLQHFLIRVLLLHVPNLRKRTENSDVEWSPPTTVQDGERLLRNMLSEARMEEPDGHKFCFILNEVDSPFLAKELGLVPDEAVLMLTSSKAVSQACLRSCVVKPLKRNDIHLLFQSYDETIEILDILREQTDEEIAKVESQRILDEYRLSVEKKVRGSASISEGAKHREQLERILVLCQICDRPITATVASGVFRRAQRWDKSGSSENQLADFLRRVERRVEQIVHDKMISQPSGGDNTTGIFQEDEDSGGKRPVLSIPEDVTISPQHVIRAAIESLPLVVKLCLEDLTLVMGDPKAFPKQIAILLWSQRFEHGRPVTHACNLGSFLEFLQLEEYTKELEDRGLNLQMILSASKRISSSVGRVVSIISESSLSRYAIWKLKQAIFRNCDLEDFMRDHKLFGQFPTAFTVLTQLVDACLIMYDRVSQKICIHEQVRRALLQRMRGDWMQRQRDKSFDMNAPYDGTGGRKLLAGKASLKAAHARILRCLRSHCCKEGSVWVPKDTDFEDVKSYFFSNIRRHLLGAGRAREADELWFNFSFMLGWLSHAGVVEVCAVAARSTLRDERLRKIVMALQSSAHALAQNPEHLAVQLCGRLSPETLPPSATNDLGGELIRKSLAHVKATQSLSNVSSSLGSITERLRSKNVIRKLYRTGRVRNPTTLATAFRSSDRAPLLVGLQEASTLHQTPLAAVVLDMNTGSVQYELPLQEKSAVPKGAFSIHGKYLVTSHESGFVIVWELDTGQSIDGNSGRSFLHQTGKHLHLVLGLNGGHTQYVTCVAYNNTNALQSSVAGLEENRKFPTRLATAGYDGEVIIWDLCSSLKDGTGKGSLYMRRTGLWGIVEDIQWSHCGGTFGKEEEIVFISQNRIMVWLFKNDVLRSFKLPGEDIGLHLIIQTDRILLGCHSGRILSMTSQGVKNSNSMISDALSFGDHREMRGSPSCHTSAITGLVRGPGQICFSASSGDGSIRVWKVSTAVCLHKVSMAQITFIGLVSSESIVVATTSEDAIILDLALPPASNENRIDGGHQPLNDRLAIRGHMGNPISCVSLAQACNFAVSGDVKGTVCVWCARTGRLLCSPEPESHHDRWKEISALAISKSGRQIMIGALYGVGSTSNCRPLISLFSFDGIGAKCTMRLDDFSAGSKVNALAFSQENFAKFALSATSDFQVRLWHIAPGKRGKLAMRYTAQPQKIESLGFTHSGARVFARGCDGSLTCWQRSTGIVLKKETGGSIKFKVEAVRFIEQDSVEQSALIVDSSGRVSHWDANETHCWKDDWHASFTDGIFASMCEVSPTQHLCKENSSMHMVYARHKNVYRVLFYRKDSMSLPSSTLKLQGMSDDVSSIALSADGNVVVCGSHDGEVITWNLSDLNKKNMCTNTVSRHKVLRHVDRESNSTVQALSLSQDGKCVAIVTWDEVLAVRLSDSEIVGNFNSESFISHVKYLRNGAILLVADDAPLLWQLNQEREILAEQKRQNDSKRRWGKVKLKVERKIKRYDSFEHIFSPKLSDDCTALAVNEPSQSIFAIGFADGSVVVWRRASTPMFSTFSISNGLPVSALDVSSDGTLVIACGKVMCHIFNVRGLKLKSVTMKKWIPANVSLTVVSHPNAVKVVCREPNKEYTEMFYIDRGDRVDARCAHNSSSVAGKEEDGPVVVLGTSQGRVHILRRGGPLPAVLNVLETPRSPKVEAPINLSLDGLLTEVVERRGNSPYLHSLDIEAGETEDGTEKNENPQDKPPKEEFTTGLASKISYRFQKTLLSWKYKKIAKLRQYQLTIWPYSHDYPGVSRVVHPELYRKLQKRISKRNLRLLLIGALTLLGIAIMIIFLLVTMSLLYLQPPVRIISSMPQRVTLLQVETERKYTNLQYTPFVPCTPPESIPNVTELWRLGNETVGFNLCNVTKKKEKVVCDDVPPTEGENCIQYRMFGKCGKDWMIGFCCSACFKCAPGCGT